VVEKKNVKKTIKKTTKKSVPKKQVKKIVKKEVPVKKSEKPVEKSTWVAIFTNQYFIIGLIILILVILGIGFAVGGKDNVDTNTGVIGDKIELTLYADYMTPGLVEFYDNNLADFSEKYPTVQIDFKLYGGIEKAYNVDWGDSERAKVAELCAADQGKGTEMMSALLNHAKTYYEENNWALAPGIYTQEAVNSLAGSIGLDIASYTNCISSGDKQLQVNAFLETIFAENLLSMDPIFKYNGEKFHVSILNLVVDNIMENKPLKPSMHIKILGKTGLDYFESMNTNNFDVFEYYYTITDEVVDVDTEEGQKIVNDLEIRLLPSFIFEGDFKESLFYDNIVDVLDDKNGYVGLFSTVNLAAVGVTPYYYLNDYAGFVDAFSNDYSMGNKDANLMILEFSDYLCPYCVTFENETMPQLKADYIDTGKVNFYYLQHPVKELHPSAPIASVAAMCAADQELYWPFHEAVFGYANSYDKNNLMAIATSVGVDLDKFELCYDGAYYLTDVDDIVFFAKSLGLGGTPSFIVGHALLAGAYPYDDATAPVDFKRLIEYELSQ